MPTFVQKSIALPPEAWAAKQAIDECLAAHHRKVVMDRLREAELNCCLAIAADEFSWAYIGLRFLILHGPGDNAEVKCRSIPIWQRFKLAWRLICQRA